MSALYPNRACSWWDRAGLESGHPMSALPPIADVNGHGAGGPLLTQLGHRRPYFRGSGNKECMHVYNHACVAQGLPTRADLQNQAMGWLRKECDSLGGGTVVRFSQNWGSSGECRLKGLLVQKGFPTCLYRVLGYFRFRPARWGRFICTACLAGTKAGRILLKPQPLPRSQISCASPLSMKSLKSRPPMRKLFGRSSRTRYTVSQFQISTSLTMKVNSFYSSRQWQMSFVQVGTS